jgi:hypothetical protein
MLAHDMLAHDMLAHDMLAHDMLAHDMDAQDMLAQDMLAEVDRFHDGFARAATFHAALSNVGRPVASGFTNALSPAFGLGGDAIAAAVTG